MADTSLNENRLGLLIWQTSNIWQSKLRKILKNHKISLNEYLIIETLFKLSSLTKIVSQISISNNSSLDVSVVSTNLTLLENKNLILRTHIDNRSKNILPDFGEIYIRFSFSPETTHLFKSSPYPNSDNKNNSQKIYFEIQSFDNKFSNK